jgi:hypothetical protein
MSITLSATCCWTYHASGLHNVSLLLCIHPIPFCFCCCVQVRKPCLLTS